jgi:hypothetical protein
MDQLEFVADVPLYTEVIDRIPTFT